MLQHYCEGEEYTTRTRLIAKYNIPSTTLQYLLENATQVKRVQDCNKYYFHKEQVETLLDQHTGR